MRQSLPGAAGPRLQIPREGLEIRGRNRGDAGGFSRVFPWHGRCTARGTIMATRPRVVIASPHPAECTLVADWLASEGFEPVRASTVETAAEEVKARAFDLLLADCAFAFEFGIHAVARAANARAPLIAVGEADAAAEAQAVARGAMYLSRPLDRAALVCSVAMAVMESRPVRRSVRKRVSRFEAVVEGARAHIIDVSNEGLRVEVPRGPRPTPPPFFNVRVPILDVTLIVRRMWSSSAPPDLARSATWYGGELSRNPARTELAWRSFVDALPGARVASQLR
jgi:CheY-like chemotaxis protein